MTEGQTEQFLQVSDQLFLKFQTQKVTVNRGQGAVSYSNEEVDVTRLNIQALCSY